MNIWLRERAPARKDAAPLPATRAEFVESREQRCAECESETTPLGLCLCGVQYGGGE